MNGKHFQAPLPKPAINSSMVLSAISCTLALCLCAKAEIYNYVDENGTRVFVTSTNDIPERYLDQIKTIKGKYDKLPVQERQIMIEDEKAESAVKLEEWKKRQLAAETKRRIEEEENKKLNAMLEEGIQKVKIDGNKVFVPAVICSSNRTSEISLVMDTGAETILLHKHITDAMGLDISKFRKHKINVVGGQNINGFLGTIDSIEVGPIRREKVTVMVTEYMGKESAGYDGLLGMDFLKNYGYEIDFKNQTINWHTKTAGQTPNP